MGWLRVCCVLCVSHETPFGTRAIGAGVGAGVGAGESAPESAPVVFLCTKLGASGASMNYSVAP